MDSPYEYLVILIRDNTERVARTAVKISTFLFQDLRDQAEKDSTDDSSPKILNRPVPVPVTDQIRNCFDEPLQMKETDVHKEFMETEAEIEEKLWDYSRYRELLTDPRDEEYKRVNHFWCGVNT